jgi:acetate kinase
MAGVNDRPRILAVNAGSTSLKVSIVEGGQTVQRYDSLDDALDEARDLDAVAHRVVHGGNRSAAVLVDDTILDELRALTDLAPLHQPAALDCLDRCRQALPGVPQVACFDTAFHTTLPREARTYALPQRLRDRVQVYGFHGLSHAWATRRVGTLAPPATRLVIAHLGGGQSLCGVRDGRSIVTTMGFTPLDGLVMATRCGALDPGAVLWMASHTDENLDHVLEKESGLLGLCGSGDMRDVLRRDDDTSRLALQVYLHRLITLLGSCVAALGGLDALVFTGGIGEHSPQIRKLVADRLEWLGISIADTGAEEITSASASVRTFVIEAREDLQAAHEATQLLAMGYRCPWEVI